MERFFFLHYCQWESFNVTAKTLEHQADLHSIVPRCVCMCLLLKVASIKPHIPSCCCLCNIRSAKSLLSQDKMRWKIWALPTATRSARQTAHKKRPQHIKPFISLLKVTQCNRCCSPHDHQSEKERRRSSIHLFLPQQL